jgi:hypothetical protein
VQDGRVVVDNRFDLGDGVPAIAGDRAVVAPLVG